MRYKYDKDTRYKIVAEMHRKGYTDIEIADEIGYAPSHVRTVLKRLGLLDHTELDVPKVLALKEAGWSIDRIVGEFGKKFTSDEIKDAVRAWEAKRGRSNSESRCG